MRREVRGSSVEENITALPAGDLECEWGVLIVELEVSGGRELGVVRGGGTGNEGRRRLPLLFCSVVNVYALKFGQYAIIYEPERLTRRSCCS